MAAIGGHTGGALYVTGTKALMVGMGASGVAAAAAF